ncbi:13502_t:CDS:2, partial [Ambispora gerdemannii]
RETSGIEERLEKVDNDTSSRRLVEWKMTDISDNEYTNQSHLGKPERIELVDVIISIRVGLSILWDCETNNLDSMEFWRLILIRRQKMGGQKKQTDTLKNAHDAKVYA